MDCPTCSLPLQRKRGTYYYGKRGATAIYLAEVLIGRCICGEETVSIPRMNSLQETIEKELGRDRPAPRVIMLNASNDWDAYVGMNRTER